jgi:glutamyl-tRNA reductase
VSSAQRIAVIGANHRSSPIGLRERMFVADTMAQSVGERLKTAGLGGFVLMSTCDRVEAQVAHDDPDDAAAIVRAIFAALAQTDAAELESATYVHRDEAAVRHIFSVAAALDSQIVGEPQVLGQMKECHRTADKEGWLSPLLDRTFQHAFRVAKRVRTETDLGSGVVSIAAASVQVARQLHGDLGDKQVLILGLGDMGELTAEHLRAAGVASFELSARPARAEAMARANGYGFAPPEELAEALVRADIVVAATGSGRIELAADDLAAAAVARRHRPVLVIDTGIPAEVDAYAEALDDIYLYTLDDLERFAMQGRSARAAGADAASAIVEEEVAVWRQREQERDAAPAITDLRSRFENARLEILAENPGIAAEEATRLLVNRLLHGPISALRRDAAAAENSDAALAEIEAAVAKLFYRDDSDAED